MKHRNKNRPQSHNTLIDRLEKENSTFEHITINQGTMSSAVKKYNYTAAEQCEKDLNECREKILARPGSSRISHSKSITRKTAIVATH
jgi:hypothetical protein